MVTTFTKFDQLGAALSELSFENVQISLFRKKDGSLWFYSVDISDRGEYRGGGIADTPTQALEAALKDLSDKQVAKVEAAAGSLADRVERQLAEQVTL